MQGQKKEVFPITDNKIKFALWITPEAKQLVDENYKADFCRSRADYIEKAIRFYTGYLHAERAADFLPRALFDVLYNAMKSFADRMGRLLFKQAVEANVVCHLLAMDTDMSYYEYEELRELCTREVKITRGELNFMDRLFLFPTDDLSELPDRID